MRCPLHKAGQPAAGFTLIEVVISVGILMTLTVAVATMLRAGFDVKEGLSQKSRVMHRLAVSMEKIANDVEQMFFVSTKDTIKNGIGRRTKGLFRIEKAGSGDKLWLTTRTHRPIVAGSNESDTTFVVYELRDSKTASGRKNLFRGEAAVIPEDLKEEPPMRLLAKNIKSMVIEAWLGDRWSKDYWDTGRGDTRNLLPKLVRISLEAYNEDRVDGDGLNETSDQAVETLTTVVFVPEAIPYNEVKEQNKSINWSGM